MRILISIMTLILIIPFASAYISQSGGSEYYMNYYVSDFEPSKRPYIPRTHQIISVEQPTTIVADSGLPEVQDCVQYEWFRGRWWPHNYFCDDANAGVKDSGIEYPAYFKSKSYWMHTKGRWLYDRNLITGSSYGPNYLTQMGSRIYE